LITELFIGIAIIVFAAGFFILIRKINKASGEAGSVEAEKQARLIEELSAARQVAEGKISWLNTRIDELTEESRQHQQTILTLNQQLAGKESENRALEERLAGLKAETEKLQDTFRHEFRNLANEILEEKTQKFTDQNKVKLEEILKPLGEKIRDFEKRVEETYDKESKERFSLAREIKSLTDLNQQISRDATNLTNALKGQVKTQGNWGEIILESILEKSGLKKDREYFIQSSFTNEQGKRLQPDVVVTYPGERNLVIDAKVSLNAYERYASSSTKEEQDLALRDHLVSVRNHIQELSSKNYQDLYQLRSLDFVMMFMPVEPAYLLAMQEDPGMWSFAYERRVLLISPTNLIAALRMISNLWRVEYQNKNAVEIARQSGDMLDKLAGLVEDILDIGNKLDSTRRSYEAAVNKLSTGKGNLIRRAEKIKELGAKPSKEIPKNLTDTTHEYI